MRIIANFYESPSEAQNLTGQFSPEEFANTIKSELEDRSLVQVLAPVQPPACCYGAHCPHLSKSLKLQTPPQLLQLEESTCLFPLQRLCQLLSFPVTQLLHQQMAWLATAPVECSGELAGHMLGGSLLVHSENHLYLLDQ